MTDHYLRQSTLGLTITLIVLPLWIGLTGQRGMAVLIGTACDGALLAYANSVVDGLPVAELVVQASAAIIMAEVFCRQTAREDVHLRALTRSPPGFARTCATPPRGASRSNSWPIRFCRGPTPGCGGPASFTSRRSARTSPTTNYATHSPRR